MGRPRHLRALPLALAALLLAACGGHPDATPPRPSPTPSPTASTPTAPVMPALARQHTDAGAKAFVRYYIALVNHAAITGVVAPLRRLTASSCATCHFFISNTSKMYDNGGSMVGGQFLIDRVWTPPGNRDSKTVYVRIHYGAQSYRQTSTAKVTHFKSGKNLLTFMLTFSDGWQVSDWVSAK